VSFAAGVSHKDQIPGGKHTTGVGNFASHCIVTAADKPKELQTETGKLLNEYSGTDPRVFIYK
jgi:hypothetical protein